MITIHQRHRQTDRQMTCDRNTALCTKVHRAVKTTSRGLVQVLATVTHKKMNECAQKSTLNVSVLFSKTTASRGLGLHCSSFRLLTTTARTVRVRYYGREGMVAAWFSPRVSCTNSDNRCGRVCLSVCPSVRHVVVGL